MKNCKPHILSQGPYLSITNCACCKRVGVLYKNLLIGYTHKEFSTFVKNYSRIDFEAHAVYFPDDSTRIIIKTPHQDIQLNLDYQEFCELKNGLQESALLLDAYQLIK
ncbi:hypothetical protein N7E81_08155 [Reichenbachiella carrageenanivorans]|uniref:Uncharacterized protein n=1 Tax=Reichenbachiella carrageenanivorans TaxID=2979869 RepID=A0ABY6D4K7_9BACT|nr:DUF6686 family protein [Reichenbachiella carrageenanivorans]UXX81071.1 hypothetical protein N7E81_08155 [Reichenbachiella carrageenanivorans]